MAPAGSLMPNFKQILLPTDFSDGSAAAADYARELAEQFDARIHALHVLEPILLPPYAGEALPPSFLDQREKFAHQEMDGWLAACQLGPFCETTSLKHGSPVNEIVRFSRDRDLDLIVMGTHGRTGLRHALIGSVAERVVREAACPVLTVRPKVHSA